MDRFIDAEERIGAMLDQARAEADRLLREADVAAARIEQQEQIRTHDQVEATRLELDRERATVLERIAREERRAVKRYESVEGAAIALLAALVIDRLTGGTALEETPVPAAETRR